MKLFIFISAIITGIIFPELSKGQSGWFYVNPLPQNNSLYSISIVNSNTAYTVGDYGMILKTVNGGINWTRQSNFNIVGILRSVSCFDGFNCIAAGLAGTTARTSNGNDWYFHCLNTSAFMFGVSMPLQDIAFTVGESGRIYKTTNGGVNWVQQQSGTTSLLVNVVFQNINTGIIVGENGTILKTTNGGSNWISLSLNTTIDFFGVNFLNANTGIAVGGNLDKSDSGIIIRTNNGGLNWHTQIDGLSNLIYAADMYDADNYVCTGDEGLICRTSNAGINWSQQYTATRFSINSVAYSDAGNVLSVGFQGEILKSSNSGINWYSLSKSASYEDINGLDYVDMNTGYFCGNKGTILKTTNGGNDFTIQNSITTKNLFSVSMLNDNFGFVCGDSGIILKTTNGGLNWLMQSISTSKQISSVYTVSSANACAAGKDGLILTTTNSGNSWLRISAGVTSNLNSVSFVPASQTGYAVGDNGKIFKSTNGGLNWSSIKSINIADLSDVQVINEQTLYVLSPVTLLHKSTNGGMSWQTLFEDPEVSLFKMSFLDNNGYLCGGGLGAGNILRTSNGGVNWYNQYINTTSRMLDIESLSSDVAVTTGQLGTILKTTTGGFPVGITNHNSHSAENFYLKQNYPNPFNPETVIGYNISKSGKAEIKVYDITGRLAKVLINKFHLPGYYEIKFSGTGFPTGVYFYKLITQDFEETRRMLLLK